MEETYKEKASCLGMSFILKKNMFASKNIINNLSCFHEFSFYELKRQNFLTYRFIFHLKVYLLCVSPLNVV